MTEEQQQGRAWFFVLDGTLIADHHRRHLIPEWDAYHAAMAMDEQINPTVRDMVLAADISPHDDWAYLTGRPDKWREATARSLQRLGLLGGDQQLRLIMRPDGSSGQSTAAWKASVMKRNAEAGRHGARLMLVDNSAVNCEAAVRAGFEAMLVCWDGGDGEGYPFPERTMELFRPLMRLHHERGSVYGDSYRQYGEQQAALRGGSARAWTREGLWAQLGHKLARYAGAFDSGGHADSLDDLIVYALLLRGVDRE